MDSLPEPEPWVRQWTAWAERMGDEYILNVILGAEVDREPYEVTAYSVDVAMSLLRTAKRAWREQRVRDY
eukprot:3328148-Amphidinium_carterae.1